MQEGQYEKAQVLIRRILHDNPNSARALELSGDLAQKTGKKEEAVGYYEQAVERYTGNNRQLQAIICLEKITKIESTNSDRFVNLAHLYKQYGLPNQGVQKIIELCAWAIENKDETTFLTGLRKIVELQPLNLRLALSYARILRSMNRSEQAEEELKRLKKVAAEQNEQAILDEISKLLPQTDGGEEELDPKSRIELGNLLYEIGSRDEAVVEFNKAVSDLIEQGDVGEAINVLNRIVEIDPANEVVQSKLQELQGGAVPAATEEKETVEATEKTEEMTTAETPVEAPSEVVGAEAAEPAEQVSETAEVGTDIFDDLIREVETYVDSAQGKAEAETPVTETEEPQTLEGQIADIEFLLKEMETPPAPSFEFATEFDEFRGNIVWEEENINKRLELARMAYDAELYETALTHARELKINKNTWPLSLEIAGASLIKLGKYSDAIKTVGPAILLEDIPQAEKVELRYLLASAYEGLGDFENALREIEHIMSTNPDYRDVREMYELLGGKTVTPTPERVPEEMQTIPSERAAEKIEIVEPYEPTEEQKMEPRSEEPAQEPTEEKEPEKMPEDEGENISFL
ncbi:hypothetical protein AMJ83_08680 [candidate division WOR_3 bacterium SM23_42]|uniref:Tetratricopeptide repeat protein n=1 Tax=candidate division WOR_3 bacterium SM23_42 TaxID=1703779 RepID=A0A0S8FSE3_UNCW3|nr:MAG: hypothetical protein AMJ83_08680 [candidate division WOR_3 bacterium SM23_42]